MKKRVRKPTVDPVVRREWFHLHEDLAWSAADIAQEKGYDIRTVRKQLEIQREEVERRNVRRALLHDALEKHQNDLCGYAKMIDKAVSSGTSLLGFKTDLLYQALRQHLPRWDLWKNIKTWEILLEEKQSITDGVSKAIIGFLKRESSISLSEKPDDLGWDKEGIVAAIGYYVESLAKGYPKPFDEQSLEVKKKAKHPSIILLSRYIIARVPPASVKEITGTTVDLMNEVVKWELFQTLCVVIEKLEKLKREIKDDLSTILLRRVLPGRCRYCPI